MPVGFIATYINLYIQKHIYTYTYLYLGIKLFQYKWLCVRLFGCLCVRVINGYPWKCHCRQVGNHVTPHRHCLRTRALTPTLPHHKGWYICMYVDWFVGSLVRWFVGLSVCLVIFVVALDAYMRTISDVFIGRLAAWRLGRTWWRKR